MIDFNFFFYDINKFDRNNNNNKRDQEIRGKPTMTTDRPARQPEWRIEMGMSHVGWQAAVLSPNLLLGLPTTKFEHRITQ